MKRIASNASSNPHFSDLSLDFTCFSYQWCDLGKPLDPEQRHILAADGMWWWHRMTNFSQVDILILKYELDTQWIEATQRLMVFGDFN